MRLCLDSMRQIFVQFFDDRWQHVNWRASLCRILINLILPLLASSRALLSRNDSVLDWRTVCNQSVLFRLIICRLWSHPLKFYPIGLTVSNVNIFPICVFLFRREGALKSFCSIFISRTSFMEWETKSEPYMGPQWERTTRTMVEQPVLLARSSVVARNLISGFPSYPHNPLLIYLIHYVAKYFSEK